MHRGALCKITVRILFVSAALLFLSAASLRAEVDLHRLIKDENTAKIIKDALSFYEGDPYINAVMLLFDEKYTIKSQQLAICKRHVMIKILKEAGKKIGTVTVPFNEYFDKVKLNIARTIQPDGTMLNVSSDAIKDESPFAQLPIYNDIKIKKITFPNVQVGSIIEYEIEFIIDNKSMPGFSFFFGLPSDWKFALARFSVETPKGIPVKFKAERLINNEPIVTSAGNKEEYMWQMERFWVKGGDEPAITNYMKVGPYVIFSTIDSWQKINDWGIVLMENQCNSDTEIEKKVNELIKVKAESKRDMIRPVYNFVSQQIRYVAVELGISAFKPYTAAEVFRNAYGDCKGKSVLLIAMLKSLGIPAYPALIMTANAGVITKDIPTLSFNHMIVAVPDGKGYIFLDPTADMLPFDKTPFLDQGCDVLILAKDKTGDFEYIPVDPPQENRTVEESRIILNRDLSAEAKENITYTGQFDWRNRAMAKNAGPGQYKKAFEEIAKSVFPGFNLKELTYPDYNDLTAPFNIKTTFTINNYARKSGNLIIFSLPVQNSLPAFLFIKVPRRAPLYLKFPFTKEEKVFVSLPEGYKIKAMPKDLNLDNTCASYIRQITVERQGITINTKFVLRNNEISPGKYGVLKSMVEKIKNSNEEEIVLEAEPQA